MKNMAKLFPSYIKKRLNLASKISFLDKLSHSFKKAVKLSFLFVLYKNLDWQKSIWQ